MKSILEKIDGDRYLEFVLSEREVNLLSSHHVITSLTTIAGRVYQVGVRLHTPEDDEEEETWEVLGNAVNQI